MGKARPPRGEGPRRAPLARRARGGGSARLPPRLPPRRLSSWAAGGAAAGRAARGKRAEREAAFTSGPPARSEPAPLRAAPSASTAGKAPREPASLPLRRHRACAPRPAPPPARAPPTGRGRSPASRRAASGEGAAPARRRRKEPRPSRVGGSVRGPRGAERKGGGGAPVCPGGAARVRAAGRSSFPAARAGGAASCAAAAARREGRGRARLLSAPCACGRRGGPGCYGERRHAIARQRERAGGAGSPLKGQAGGGLPFRRGSAAGCEHRVALEGSKKALVAVFEGEVKFRIAHCTIR